MVLRYPWSGFARGALTLALAAQEPSEQLVQYRAPASVVRAVFGMCAPDEAQSQESIGPGLIDPTVMVGTVDAHMTALGLVVHAYTCVSFHAYPSHPRECVD